MFTTALFASITQFLMTLMHAYPILAALALLLGCALSATILPFPSEVLLLTYYKLNPDSMILSIALASIGNTIGGMISFYMGHVLKNHIEKRQLQKLQKLQKLQNLESQKKLKSLKSLKKKIPKAAPATSWFGQFLQKYFNQRYVTVYAKASIRRYGIYALLASWVPIIGDILCLLAGYFRLPVAKSAALMLFGKTLRYIFVLGFGINLL